MLNADQKCMFDSVKDHLLHHQHHETNECRCDLKPLRMFVSGVGGTGKSFLIEAIKALVTSIWPSNDLTCYCSTYWFGCFQCRWYHHSLAFPAAH